MSRKNKSQLTVEPLDITLVLRRRYIVLPSKVVARTDKCVAFLGRVWVGSELEEGCEGTPKASATGGGSTSDDLAAYPERIDVER
jgi:hypothetical protein